MLYIFDRFNIDLENYITKKYIMKDYKPASSV